jgi:hypothetical protein
MKVVHTNDINKQVLIDLFIDNWGDDEMVVSSGTYQLSDFTGDSIDNVIVTIFCCFAFGMIVCSAESLM